jgi:20S proteasome alpha/beta subunit
VTSIVGVLCTDGVVIGADSSTTFCSGQAPTIEQRTEKIHVIGKRIIIAGTGAVGLDQRFEHLVDMNLKNGLFEKDRMELARNMCQITIENFASTGVKMGSYGALVGFCKPKEVHLCEFDCADFQPEFKTESLWYASLGSAQIITDPFLGLMRNIFWQKGRPNLQEGIFAVTWALEHAIEVNPGGVNGPIRIAVIERADSEKYAAREIEDEELEEHRQSIEQAKERLRQYRGEFSNSSNTETPNIPLPKEK